MKLDVHEQWLLSWVWSVIFISNFTVMLNTNILWFSCKESTKNNKWSI